MAARPLFLYLVSKGLYLRRVVFVAAHCWRVHPVRASAQLSSDTVAHSTEEDNAALWPGLYFVSGRPVFLSRYKARHDVAFRCLLRGPDKKAPIVAKSASLPSQARGLP